MHCTIQPAQTTTPKEIIMDISKSTLLATVLFSGVSAFASAGNLDVLNEQTARPVVVIQGQQSAPLTRADVKAQLLAAQANGDLIAAEKAGDLIIGENGETARELNAHLYPAVSAPGTAPAPSRDQSQRHARANDKSYFGI